MTKNSSALALRVAFAAACTLGFASAGCGAAPGDGSESNAATEEALTSGCGVAVVVNRTDDNYCGYITVKNAGAAAVHHWTVDIDLPAGVRVDYIDSGVAYSQTGTHVQFVPGASKATLAPSASYEIVYCNSDASSLLAKAPVAKSELCTTTPAAPPAATTTTAPVVAPPAVTAAPSATTTPGADLASKTPLGQYVMTWYSFQDNTPVNSSLSASGRKLIPYISVAVPFRLLKAFGGTIAYGDHLYVDFLAGRTMPNGMKHTGWVQVDDFCGDSGDDSYCFQPVGGASYPNVDLYIGDFTKSGMSPTSCSGPAGSGQQLTKVSIGSAGPSWVGDYGGAALGSGKCGVLSAAKPQQGKCWDYTPPSSSASECASCTGASCAGY